jgi:hypothetical protein
MAKKSRTSTKSAPTFAGIQRGSTTTEFNPDYTAVKTDLKRIGILAGSFFVVLIVLSLFLR